MSLFNCCYRALVICVGAVLSTGCGAQQASAPATLLPAARLGGHSWTAPNTSSQDLLYVTGDCGGICVFTYPGNTPVGGLTDANTPQGECVDKAGDIFVADFGRVADFSRDVASAGILEYAHGGTKPIATLRDPGYRPQSCSIDPTSGNLAVANDGAPIAIYAGAKGDPTYYTDPKAYLGGFCAYDNKGNLFIGGQKMTASGGYVLVEMPKGSKTFKSIELDSALDFQYNIQWAGKYLALAYGSAVIYHVAINDAKGTVIGSTVLNGTFSGPEAQFWIQDGTIIEPYGNDDDVGFWNYPSGGTLRNSIDAGNSELFGTVVSPATSR